MSYEELLGWYDYFEKRPVGWREDDRTSKLLQAQGVKEKPWKLFPSLERIFKKGRHADEDGAGIRASAFFKQMMNAVGGDKIPL